MKGSLIGKMEAELLYKSPSNVACLRSLDEDGQFFTNYHQFSDFSSFEIIDQR